MKNITVDFAELGITYNNCTLNNNWCDDFHFPESYRQDMEFLCRKQIGFNMFRIWLKLEEIYDKNKGEYSYERYYSYIETASSHSRELLINLDINTENDPNEWIDIIKNILVHYKQRFNNIVYVECLNEPDLINIEPALYYKWYQCCYHAVYAVNRSDICGKLLLGGPVLAKYTSTYMEDFLYRYGKDESEEKLLDFVAVHDYASDNDGDGPIRYEHMNRIYYIRSRVEATLEKNGLSKDLPLFITETGVFPGERATDCFEEDMYAQSAGCAVIAAMYGASGEKNNIFHWAVRHKTNSRKNMIPEGKINELTPYGRLLTLLAPMQGRVAKVSTSYENYSNGPGAFAVSDGENLQVLLWNYNYVDYKKGCTQLALKIKGIPFGTDNIRATVWDLDGKIQTNVVPPTDIFEEVFELPRNYVVLLNLVRDNIKVISQPTETDKAPYISSAKNRVENAVCLSEVKEIEKVGLLDNISDEVTVERSFDGRFWEGVYTGKAINGEICFSSPVQARYLREKNGRVIMRTDSRYIKRLWGCSNDQRQYSIKKDELLQPAVLDGKYANLIMAIGKNTNTFSAYVEIGEKTVADAVLKLTVYDEIRGWREYANIEVSKETGVLVFEVCDTLVRYVKIEAQGQVQVNRFQLSE